MSHMKKPKHYCSTGTSTLFPEIPKCGRPFAQYIFGDPYCKECADELIKLHALFCTQKAIAKTEKRTPMQQLNAIQDGMESMVLRMEYETEAESEAFREGWMWSRNPWQKTPATASGTPSVGIGQFNAACNASQVLDDTSIDVNEFTIDTEGLSWRKLCLLVHEKWQTEKARADNLQAALTALKERHKMFEKGYLLLKRTILTKD